MSLLLYSCNNNKGGFYNSKFINNGIEIPQKNAKSVSIFRTLKIRNNEIMYDSLLHYTEFDKMENIIIDVEYQSDVSYHHEFENKYNKKGQLIHRYSKGDEEKNKYYEDRYYYDENNNLIRIITRRIFSKATSIIIEYDERNRLSSVIKNNGPYKEKKYYSYDSQDNLLKEKRKFDTKYNIYNNENKLIKSFFLFGKDTAYITEYKHDKDNNLIKRVDYNVVKNIYSYEDFIYEEGLLKEIHRKNEDESTVLKYKYEFYKD